MKKTSMRKNALWSAHGVATLAVLALLAPAILPAAALADDAVAEKAQVCAACHGEKGSPIDKSIPVLWGQNEGYIYLELRDYKLGNRKNDIMNHAGLEKEDMKALAAYFAQQSWPNLQQPQAPQDVAKHAESVANSAGCKGCHRDGYLGDSTNPRLAGQSQTYLRDTMAAFRDGARTNNPWMAALLKTYSDSDIDALAQYLAGL